MLIVWRASLELSPLSNRGIQTRLKGQYNAGLTLSPRLHVKPLITAIRAIMRASFQGVVF